MEELTCGQCLRKFPVAETVRCVRCFHTVCTDCQTDHEARHLVNDETRRRDDEDGDDGDSRRNRRRRR